MTSLLVAAAAVPAQPVEVATVVSQTISRKARLPGELYPYLKVPVQARVAGFVEVIEVDRGSVVRKGQLVARLSAPELAAQVAAAEAKVLAIESQRAEGEAKLVAAQSTHERLKAASATPGVVAAHEVVIAGKSVDASQAALKAIEAAAAAARAAIKPLVEMQSYLEVKAPFDGVVAERLAHPGALTGPNAGPLVILEQTSRLRLVVAVPEADSGSIARGAAVAFKVPAHVGVMFTGTIARVAPSLDARTRTLAVELDVANPKGALSPGMYADVDWPVRRARASLLVPPTAVAGNTERTFVVRVSDGKAEWVNVSRGVAVGDLIEVMGQLQAGDAVVKRATDEIRDGSALQVKK